MAKLNVEIKGQDKLLNKFKQHGEKAEKLAASLAKISAQEITLDAKRLAPKDTGELAQSIGNEKIDDLHYRVFALAAHAPYMEFGTGGLVEVPPELKDLAIQFKGQGIRKVNLRPQPFLWPSFVIGGLQFKFELKKALKKLGNG